MAEEPEAKRKSQVPSWLTRTATKLGLKLLEMFWLRPRSLDPVARMVDAELGGSATRPVGPGAHWLRYPRRDLFGLALSGGGVRSATFNLGLLQGLHERGLLRSFDYLATVSGGGYIGAFWSAWRARQTEGSTADFPPLTSEGGEPAEVRHLREYSNFLSPQLGLLSADTGRMVAALVAALVPALLASLSLITLAFIAWLLLAWVTLIPGIPPFILLGGIAAFGFAATEQQRRSRETLDEPGRPYVALAIAATALVLGAWYLASTRLASPSGILATFLPVAVLVSAILGMVVLRTLASRWLRPVDDEAVPATHVPGDADTASNGPSFGVGPVNAPPVSQTAEEQAVVQAAGPPGSGQGGQDDAAADAAADARTRSDAQRRRANAARLAWRGAFSRVVSRLLFAVVAWSVFAAAWELGGVLGRKPVPLRVAGAVGGTALGVLFGWVQKMLARQFNKPITDKLMDRLKPRLPQVLAYLVLASLALGVVMALRSPVLSSHLFGVTVTCIAITYSALIFLDPNIVGIHVFYRSRLARAFLGASNRPQKGSRGDRTEEAPDDDLPLTRLRRDAPLHLVCCAANDLNQSGRLRNLRRGAESAVLSPVGFSVGAQWQEWRNGEPVPSLAAAVTASGAAFNSQMGARSMKLGPAVTFLMATLNLRLGLWLRHPAHPRKPGLRTGLLAGLPFYKEMLGFTRADGHDVHLSDGGHFENMALYELIRRHCRYILASDCGMDPDVAFDDFGNLVRRVREDFGVEIAIDLSPLMPGPEGRARQPMVAGDIRYPDGDTGVLLLIKPTITGTEPVDVAQYRTRNKDFPHESTLDQFYDEAQWESYRRLGQHAAGAAFPFVSVAPAAQASLGDEDRRRRAARIFARARFDWLSPLPRAVENASRLSQRLEKLEDLLSTEACIELYRQVYRELAASTGNGLVEQPAQIEVAPANGSGGGITDAAAATASDIKTVVATLRALRHALLLMQDVHQTNALDTEYTHPLNLGWMNYFARWTHTAAFRTWWPLLRTTFPLGFSRFLETHFGAPLPGAGGGLRVELGSTVVEGYAVASWRELHPGSSAGGQCIDYHMAALDGDQAVYRIQAALLWDYHEHEDLVAWDADALFVPPGLWGVGIGEDFVTRLAQKGSPIAGKRHVVRIPMARTTAAERKEGADRAALYRLAGFHQTWLDSDPALLKAVFSMPRSHGRVLAYSWLVRDVGGASSS